MKWTVLLIFAATNVVMLSVNLRLMMDSVIFSIFDCHCFPQLPTGAHHQHPKLNKNFRAFLTLNQKLILKSSLLSR